MINKIIISLISVSIFFFSCNEKNDILYNQFKIISNSVPISEHQYYITDSLKDIKIKDWFEDKIGIGKINKSQNTVELRIITSTAKQYGQYVVIKNNYDTFSAELYNYREIIDTNKHKLIGFSITNYKLQSPKSGWPAFFKKLYDLNVDKLPGFDKTKFYPDETGYIVEFISKKTGEIEMIQYPDLFDKNRLANFKELSPVVHLLNYIQSEF